MRKKVPRGHLVEKSDSILRQRLDSGKVFPTIVSYSLKTAINVRQRHEARAMLQLQYLPKQGRRKKQIPENCS